jgi:GST-like protein
MIDLYFWPTGNGKKIIILLEELGLPYTIKPINIGRGDQLTPDFLKMSPNGRMPAIVDDEPMGGGEPISIFESGPIMMYLAEKHGRFWPQDPRSKYEVAQWVGWQLANQVRSSASRATSAAPKRPAATATCPTRCAASTTRRIASTAS